MEPEDSLPYSQAPATCILIVGEKRSLLICVIEDHNWMNIISVFFFNLDLWLHLDIT